MIRLAAVGDLHFDKDSHNRLSVYFEGLEDKADLLLLAGDLTNNGHPDEAKALAHDLRKCPIPVVAVLGNHDLHLDQADAVVSILQDAKARVLRDSSTTFSINNVSVGIAGSKGFGGGFVGACGADYGEPEMKSFMRHSKKTAKKFEEELLALKTDYKVGLLHYSPTAQTLMGEKKEIYPFLGCYYLAEALDHGGADIAFHGHAHKGTEKGETPGGTPVRNVAQPVIRHAFNIYCLNRNEDLKKENIILTTV
ncbi:MAG: metallophosphoesterase [Bacteriovoracaceae bacterium]